MFHGAREMGRRENLRMRLERLWKVISYVKIEVFPKQTDEMWCIAQARKKAWKLG